MTNKTTRNKTFLFLLKLNYNIVIRYIQVGYLVVKDEDINHNPTSFSPLYNHIQILLAVPGTF